METSKEKDGFWGSVGPRDIAQSHNLIPESTSVWGGTSLKFHRKMIPARGPQTLKCKDVHGHGSNITWSLKARQEDRAAGTHNMDTSPLTRLSPKG